MDPVTAGIATSAVGGGIMQSIGAVSQDRAEAAANKYNAQADILAGNQASNSAAANQANTIRTTNQQIGEQGAALAQANIGTGGSARTIERQSSGNARLDALNVWYGGELERESAMRSADLERYQQLINQQKETSDVIGASAGAGTKLLSRGTSNYVQTGNIGQGTF